jgi:hypothetical protein
VVHPHVALRLHDLDVLRSHLLVPLERLGEQALVHQVAQPELILPVVFVGCRDRKDTPESEGNIEQAVIRVRDARGEDVALEVVGFQESPLDEVGEYSIWATSCSNEMSCKPEMKLGLILIPRLFATASRSSNTVASTGLSISRVAKFSTPHNTEVQPVAAICSRCSGVSVESVVCCDHEIPSSATTAMTSCACFSRMKKNGSANEMASAP